MKGANTFSAGHVGKSVISAQTIQAFIYTMHAYANAQRGANAHSIFPNGFPCLDHLLLDPRDERLHHGRETIGGASASLRRQRLNLLRDDLHLALQIGEGLHGAVVRREAAARGPAFSLILR